MDAPIDAYIDRPGIRKDIEELRALLQKAEKSPAAKIRFVERIILWFAKKWIFYRIKKRVK